MDDHRLPWNKCLLSRSRVVEDTGNDCIAVGSGAVMGGQGRDGGDMRSLGVRRTGVSLLLLLLLLPLLRYEGRCVLCCIIG